MEPLKLGQTSGQDSPTQLTGIPYLPLSRVWVSVPSGRPHPQAEMGQELQGGRLELPMAMSSPGQSAEHSSHPTLILHWPLLGYG